jgi:hypothetical protein
MNMILTRKLHRFLHDNACYDFQDILEGIKDGSLQSFAVGDTWVVTQVGDYPRQKVLHVMAAVGNFDEFAAVTPFLKDYAKDIGATLITGSGRDGWRKKLHLLPGWECKGSIYSMEVEDE